MTTPTTTVALTVNGEASTLAVGPTETLLATLRERLHLTGAKRGCDYGVCGACTVLVDGRPLRSCLALTWNCAGRRVDTIESVDADGTLAPVQAALLAHGAVQCGFCTPGIVMSVQALLAGEASPSREAIRAALSAHLCRCSGYSAIVAAVEQVAKEART